MSVKPQVGEAHPAREAQVRRALFRGEQLHMRDEHYRAAVVALIDPLLRSDGGGGDLTVEALGLTEGRAMAQVLAKEEGVAAGIEEFEWLLGRNDVLVKSVKRDGEAFERGDVLAEVEGGRGESAFLRAHRVESATADERDRHDDAPLAGARAAAESRDVCCGHAKDALGIAGQARGASGRRRHAPARVCSDAILIKNNHLALLASREEDAVVPAVERAWSRRQEAAFIEIEVRSAEAAVACGARVSPRAPGRCRFVPVPSASGQYVAGAGARDSGRAAVGRTAGRSIGRGKRSNQREQYR